MNFYGLEVSIILHKISQVSNGNKSNWEKIKIIWKIKMTSSAKSTLLKKKRAPFD